MNKTDPLVKTITVRSVVMPWGKEHQLTAAESIKKGEVIVSETPLVSVPDANPKYTSYTWDLVDNILSSADMTHRYFAQRLKVSKWLMDAEDHMIERALAKKHKCTRDMVKSIYFGVSTNNIGYEDANSQIIGHGIYPVISRSNHSCRPNAFYQPGNVEAKEVTLVAGRDIQAREAVTWNYADTPAFIDVDYCTRNFNLLNTFRFVCSCERCQEEIPPELAKLPNLTRYFDGLLKDYAMQHIEDEMTRR